LFLTLPHAEITRDNNGSLSDSSFDVESEENVDRRRCQASTSAGGASRLVNSPHQHRRDAGAVGGPRSRHGPPATSYTGSRGQQQQHDSRRHHRSATDPDPRRSAAPGPAGPTTDYRSGRSRTGYSGHKAASTQDAAYAQQPSSSSSRLFVALFDYDPQTMSPNQNAINDELPFTEGQIIKVTPLRAHLTQNWTIPQQDRNDTTEQ